jgi:hypothetical protein
MASEVLVPLGQARPFQGECDRSRGLSETTNAMSTAFEMNPACQVDVEDENRRFFTAPFGTGLGFLRLGGDFIADSLLFHFNFLSSVY